MSNEPAKQDTGKFRKNTKDQFYTSHVTAKACIEEILKHIPLVSNYLWIEPSAGNGSFLQSVYPDIHPIALDIEPKADGILKQDYLKWTPPQTEKPILVYGNPPFGRQSSLAKAFIAKSCKFAHAIAFILPKSFTKPSMYKVFDLKFHLTYTSELKKDSFLINDSPHDVPCVFQIWQKKSEDRPAEIKVVPQGFSYVKSEDGYDMAFRRVGGLAGKCYKSNGTAFSIQSHYFLKFADTSNLETIIEKINSHIFPSNTVGPRSLSKSEVSSVVNEIILETQPSS